MSELSPFFLSKRLVPDPNGQRSARASTFLAVISLGLIVFVPSCGELGQPASSFSAGKINAIAKELDSASDGIVWLKHDFGIIPPQSKRIHRFQIHNDTDESWTLKNIRTTCACTVADADAESIAPHSSGWFDVRYSAPANRSDDCRQVAIFFKEKSANCHVLKLCAKVRDAVETNPAYLVFHHQLTETESRKSAHVEIENYSYGPFGGLRMNGDSKWLSAAWSLASRNESISEPKELYRIDVQVDFNNLAIGHHQGRLAVTPSNAVTIETASPGGSAHQEQPLKWDIPIDVFVTSPVRVTPSSIFFGSLLQAEAKTKTVTVHFEQAESVPSIDDVCIDHSFGEELHVNAVKLDANTWLLKSVFFPTTGRIGLATGEVIVDMPGDLPTLKLPVQANVKQLK